MSNGDQTMPPIATVSLRMNGEAMLALSHWKEEEKAVARQAAPCR